MFKPWSGGVLLALLLLVAPLHAQTPSWVLYDTTATDADLLQKQLQKAGAHVRYRSRWVNAISIDAAPRSLQRIRKMPGVLAIRPVRQLNANGGAGRSTTLPERAVIAQEPFDSAFYGFNFRPMQRLGVPPAHRLGFTGAGIRIAIIDTGFEPGHESLSTRVVSAQRDFIQDDNSVANSPGERTDSLDQEIHGTWVWSLIGGYRPGILVSAAFNATFILAKVDVTQVGPADFAADEDRWVRAVEWADSMGARIINSSIGFRDFVDKGGYTSADMNGDEAIASVVADQLARRGILLVAAMGAGTTLPASMQTPADADSIISVGAIDSIGLPAVFRNGLTSSRGPTIDGRLKPELVAPGRDLYAARAQNPVGYDAEVEGTSMAAAFVSGGAAMFMQAWPSLSMMAVRNALLLSGSNAESPNNIFGYGVPNIAGAIFLPEGLIPAGITGATFNNILQTLQPTFTWIAPLRHPAMSALYRLEIATDPAFTNVIYTDTIRDATSLTVKRPLPPHPALHWRVVAEGPHGIRRVTRTTVPFTMPDWVRLTTLNNPTTTAASPRPTFTWEPLAAPEPIGPLNFEVQIINAQTGRVVQTLPAGTSTSATPTIALAPNINYNWRVIATAQSGAADTISSIGNFLVTTNEHPPATLLYQNFPNPFPRPDLALSETQIWFDVTTTTDVQLAIYDLRGRLVRSLIPADPTCGTVQLTPGQYGRGADPDSCVRTRWDGRAQNGEFVTRGVYVLRLRAGGTDQIKRILYMPQ